MSDKRERPGILRAAPEPRLKALPVEEALDLAKKAFYDARYEQGELMALYLNHLLFDPKTVTYSRLLAIRTEARKQVEQAQRVALLVDDAISAFKATAPVEDAP